MPSPPHRNRPGEIPRLPNRDPLPLSRGNILGTRGGSPPWTMFMPGQSQGVPSELPTTWPPAGSLLRVPKCVFLTSCPPVHLWGKTFTLMSKWGPFGYLGHWYDAVVRDTRTTPATAFPYGTLIFGGFTGGYTYMGWTIDPQYPVGWNGRRKFHQCEVVRNMIYYEHYRLIEEFKKAKTTLETMYPGQVFVEVTEFFPHDPAVTIAPNDELSPLVFDVYTPDGIIRNAPKSGANGPLWCLGPDRTPTDFFGTDFYHIYCGYQTDSGTSDPRSVNDVLSRFHWTNRVWGYKLDRDFNVGFDEWVETPAIDCGYEGGSQAATQREMEGSLGRSLTYEDAAGGETGGKLDKLRLGWPNFSGYRVDLHEYDGAWNFAGANLLGVSDTEFPPGSVLYGDQDWVEQTIVLGYDIRKAIYEDSHDPYGDEYFPGPDGLHGDGAYNLFIKYPGTDQYVNTYLPRLAQQHNLLKTAVLNLGPKCVAIWNALIAEYGLGELGITYQGGSSAVTADSIVRSVQDHYGLAR